MRRALARCLGVSPHSAYHQCCAPGASIAAQVSATQAQGNSQVSLQQQQQQRPQPRCDSSNNSSSPIIPSRDRTWDASCSGAVVDPQQTRAAPQQKEHNRLQQQQQPAWRQQPGHQRLLQNHQLLPPAAAAGGGLNLSSLFSSSSSNYNGVGTTSSNKTRRAYSSRPMVNPSMPPELASLITEAAANKAARPPPPPLEPRPLTFESRRAGVIAIKAGMMQDWDEFGVRVPLTVLWIDECMVLRHKHIERDGVTSLVLSCGSKKPKQLHPRQLGEFQAAGLPLKRKLWECRVSEDAILPPGTLIGASHFKAGQYLDISGTTKGKGFAGVMKRWNFSGQNATHGNTKHHRAPGSIGGRTDPGRVWKGKKMPGRLGGEAMTFKNIWLYKVDPQRNLLYVRGQVPGPAGSFVLVRDAFRWRWTERQAVGLPFPTHIPTGQEEELSAVEVAKRDKSDPYRIYREDVGYFEANWKGD